MHVVTLLIGALVLFLLLDGWVIFRKGKRRFKKGQPGLGDIISRHDFGLKIESSGRMSRFEISRALEDGGRPALDALVRTKYKGANFHEWSIDYAYPHIDYNGKRQFGFWSTSSREDEATIFFYRYVDPPKPKPLPKPEVKPDPFGWNEAKERERIDLYLAGPSAFWLNLDYGDTPNARDSGFEWAWMRDPAPIPERFMPSDEVRRAAEAMTGGRWHETIEHRKLSSKSGNYNIFVMTDDGDTIKLKATDFARAQRLARTLDEECVNRVLAK